MYKKSNLIIVTIISFLLISCAGGKENLNPEEKEQSNVYKYSVKNIDGNDVKLSDYKGKVLLIVNVASKCGFTYQYEGLQNLYKKYKDQGFEILAFPCNDFNEQEPGTNEEIKYFCSSNYDVTFQLFDKITLEGEEKSPLFEMLTNNPRTGDSSILWNFEKFLVDKDGYVIDRFRSITKPESDSITELVETLLQLN